MRRIIISALMCIEAFACLYAQEAETAAKAWKFDGIIRYKRNRYRISQLDRRRQEHYQRTDIRQTAECNYVHFPQVLFGCSHSRQ